VTDAPGVNPGPFDDIHEWSGDVGALPDILAVIESAKARGGVETLERFIRKALPDAKDDEVREAADVALEVIESVPVFLARARQASRERGLSALVLPLLELAEQYYLQPMDLLPEMTLGLPGLLDDSYLIIRIIENLEKGPQAFLDWDLDDPARFLQRLMDPAVTLRLDDIAAQAMHEVSSQLAELWHRLSHPA
jgi:uncharacterized membrane protein YkvA (DUF1232 family)